MISPKHSSKRKPHNQDAGYIAERKFYDSHIVIYNAEAQGIDVAPCKYAIVCSQHGAICSASSVPQSRQSMKNPEFCEECMKAEQWANRKSPRFQKALQIARTQPASAAPLYGHYCNDPDGIACNCHNEQQPESEPAKAAQDSPLVELGRAAVTAEAELERVKAQRDELLAELKETLDALYNETAGKIDTRWIMTVKANASAAISKHEGRAS